MIDFLERWLGLFIVKSRHEATEWAIPLGLLLILLGCYFRQWWIVVIIFGPQIALRVLNSMYWHVLHHTRDVPFLREMQAIGLMLSAAILAEIWRRRGVSKG